MEVLLQNMAFWNYSVEQLAQAQKYETMKQCRKGTDESKNNNYLFMVPSVL